jgi:hypothetical protein
MNGLDELLDFLNLSERLSEFVAWAIHGALERIYVPRACGKSGFAIELLLRARGIPIWGRGLSRDTLYFSCKRKQAEWARWVLSQTGIESARSPLRARPVPGHVKSPTAPFAREWQRSTDRPHPPVRPLGSVLSTLLRK